MKVQRGRDRKIVSPKMEVVVCSKYTSIAFLIERSIETDLNAQDHRCIQHWTASREAFQHTQWLGILEKASPAGWRQRPVRKWFWETWVLFGEAVASESWSRADPQHAPWAPTGWGCEWKGGWSGCMLSCMGPRKGAVFLLPP